MIDNSMNSMEKQAGAEKILDFFKLIGNSIRKNPERYGNVIVGQGVTNGIDASMYSDDNDTLTGWWRALPFASAINAATADDPSLGRIANGLVNAASPAGALTNKVALPQAVITTDAAAQLAYTGVEGVNAFKAQAAQNIATAAAQKRTAEQQLKSSLAQEGLFKAQAKQEKLKMLLGVGAGVLALGGAGYALYRWLKDRSEERASRTRMKMKISTPDGKDAVVDLPINNPSLSGKLEDEFNRGVTRTVRRTARYNSMKLDPMTNKYIPYPEWHKKYGQGTPVGTTGQEYAYKQARLVNMPKYNMVDCFPETVQDSGIVTTGSDKVKQFLQALDIPEQSMGKIAALQQFEADMKKQAAGIESQKASLSEIAGGITAPLLAGGAAGLIANKKFGLDTTNSVLVGGGTAMLAKLLGIAAAGMAPTRTVAEQATQDMESSALTNLLVPGIAQFNQVQRAKITSDKIPTLKQKDEQMAQQESKPVVQNTPLESDDLMDDEDI